MKTCFRCKTSKPDTDFYAVARNSDGLHSWCARCLSLWKSEKRKARGSTVLEVERASYHKHREVKRLRGRARNKGLTVEQCRTLLEQAQGACRICGESRHESQMVIDHDHQTGRVRGVLCCKCNAGIGFFDESPEKMLLAIEYLKIASYGNLGNASSVVLARQT